MRLLRPLDATLSAVCLAACGAAGDPGGVGGLGGESSSTGAAGAGASAEPGPSPCGETPHAPPFEIGVGEVCFEPIPDDGVVPRILGFQGGFHVWLAILCADCPSEMIAEVGVQHLGGGWVYEPGEVVIELRSQQAAGLFGMMGDSTQDPETIPSEGTPLTAHISVRTLDGTLLHEGSREIVLGKTETWVNKCDPDPATCGQPTALPCCQG